MPGIDYTIGMKSSGFDAGVKSALGKLASIATKAAAITAAAALATGVGVGAIIQKSIGKAAEIEGLETAFVPLLGSVKDARERMEDLSKFAAQTPFEIPEIAAASKTLETLTRGALSTGKGLTLVGDVASGTNAPFGELSVTIGRLYDGLDSGRPVGEALARLQELGSISGTTRAKIEDLQKEGAKGESVWSVAEAALSRFTGSMQLQSATWNGKLSNLSDTISMVMAEFGKPIMDSLKPYLDGAISRIESIRDVGRQVGESLGSALDFARAAFDNGKLGEVAGSGLKLAFLESVDVLGRGLRAAVAGVGAALRELQIGSIVENALLSGVMKMGSVLKGVMADFAETMGRFDKAKQFRNEEYGFDLASRGLASNASALLSDADLSAAGSAFAGAFASSLGGAAVVPGLAEERERWESMTSDLRSQAAADAENRRRIAEDNANRIAAGAARTSGGDIAEAAAKQQTNPTRGMSMADRLAQIGGYVGGSAAGLQQRAAEATARWTEQSARALQTIVQRGSGRTATVF